MNETQITPYRVSYRKLTSVHEAPGEVDYCVAVRRWNIGDGRAHSNKTLAKAKLVHPGVDGVCGYWSI